MPDGSTAEAWAGRDCAVPDPCIIVRLLLTRGVVGGDQFFCVPTYRGLDLPSLALVSDSTSMTTAEGLAALADVTYGRRDLEHVCVGYIRNVVPRADPSYSHPTPWAHVPVFVSAMPAAPTCDGTWVTLESARSDLSVRHWWPIVEHYLGSSGSPHSDAL